MGAERLLRDYRIPLMAEGHKHSTNDWVNVHCPHCGGSQDYHLGIHTDLTACHCWRCGKHKVDETLSLILNLPKPEVWSLIKKYKKGGRGQRIATEPRVSIQAFKYPEPYGPLNCMGNKYLQSRGFNPEYIAEEWGVCQTGPIARLDGLAYPHRLIIPVRWDDEVVSFQTRDMTGKSERKYLICPPGRERVFHKNIVYGQQKAWKDLSGLIVVEGVMDVWRFGENAAATFGTSFTMAQVMTLAKQNDRFIIIFDNEMQAQTKARELAVKLKTLGKEVVIQKVVTDPADLTQKEANKMIEDLI